MLYSIGYLISYSYPITTTTITNSPHIGSS
nr:MAG TPA: hypothetical protein [Caudoviricetes sp.]